MFYSEHGLERPWEGRVWLNPPYGGEAGKFVTKMRTAYDVGDISAVICVVNAHCTDTSWFQLLWDGVLCFTDHRVDFHGDGERSGSTHGSVFVYFGPDPDLFEEHFSEFGKVVVARRQQSVLEQTQRATKKPAPFERRRAFGISSRGKNDEVHSTKER